MFITDKVGQAHIIAALDAASSRLGPQDVKDLIALMKEGSGTIG